MLTFLLTWFAIGLIIAGLFVRSRADSLPRGHPDKKFAAATGDIAVALAVAGLIVLY